MNPAILGFIKKELRQALRDTRMRALIFLVPTVQLTLFAFALSTDVKNIRLAALGAPADRLLARVEERAIASGWFIKAKTPPGADAFALLKTGRAEAVIIAPPGNSAVALERQKPVFQLLIDAADPNRARQIERYALAITRAAVGPQTGAGRQIAAERRAAPREAAFALKTLVLYNPRLESAVFLLPGIIAMEICLVTIILTAMALAREREKGTIETLISAPVSPNEIISGKMLPYILLGMANLPIVAATAVYGFGVPMQGHWWQLLLGGLAFITATVSVGLLISTFARSQQQAMMGGFMFLFPAMLLSGVMFPVENMPELLRPLSWLNPLFWFTRLARDIMLKGAAFGALWPSMLALAGIAAAAYSAGAARFKSTLN